MAVWASPTFKLDIFKALYEFDVSLPAIVLGPRISPYLKPHYGTSGLRPDDAWEDVAEKMAILSDEVDASDLDDWKAEYGTVGRWMVGTEAVFAIVHAVWHGRFTGDGRLDRAWIDGVTAEYGKLIGYSTQAPNHLVRRKWDERDESLTKMANVLEDVSEGFKFSRFAFTGDPKKRELREWDQKKYFGEGRRCYYGHAYGNTLFLKGSAEYVNRGLVLTKAHVDYVVGALVRLANTLRYYASKFANDSAKSADVIRFLALQVDSAHSARGETVFKVPRAFHKCRTLTQMAVMESSLPEAYQGELDDYVKGGLSDIVTLEKYASSFGVLNQLERLELAHAYKWIPCPDYDPSGAFGIVKDMHMNARASGADPDAPPEKKALWSRIRAERVMNLAVAYREIHGAWPPNMNVRGSSPVYAELLDYDVTGLLKYVSYGQDIAAQVKDKATVPARADREQTGKVGIDERSYLLWYMSDGYGMDTVVEKELYVSGESSEENYAKASYKAESHKPDSRLFFIMPPKTRTILGEFEGNVSRVAEHYPGSLMGKNPATKGRIIEDIMDVHARPENIHVDCENFVVTFDLTKFSPKSNYNVTADYHLFWSKVYNEPALAKMSEIGCQARIVHNQCGLKMEYQNVGPDLEGMRGRMQTMFHADMLGAACRLAVEQRVIVGRSKLGVFIDDGAVRISCIGDGDESRVNLVRFTEIMQMVYDAGGQDANPAKTVASDQGGEILADIYYRGLKVPVGLKAVMKMHPDYENAASALTEELDGMFSTAQGAVKDGADWIHIYRMYIEACLKSINRWARTEAPIVGSLAMAMKLFTPKSYGGFGMPSIQSLVSTAAVSATAEGMGMLNCIARAVPTTRRMIRAIVAKPVVIRDALSVLRDPTRVRAVGPVMVENRLTMKIVRWLVEHSTKYKSFMAQYQDKMLIDHATAVAEAILSRQVINIPDILRAWKATPLAYIESVVGKFKRSVTIISLIGQKAVTQIRSRNRDDLMAILFGDQ